MSIKPIIEKGERDKIVLLLILGLVAGYALGTINNTTTPITSMAFAGFLTAIFVWRFFKWYNHVTGADQIEKKDTDQSSS